MGLSIHYSGVLRDRKLLAPLIAEVKEISETLDWSSHVIDDKDLKGISFAPERSEPVFLTFDRNNRLLSPMNIPVKEIYDGVRFDKELLFTTSVKTQYAGPDVHIAVIKFLKYISAKYLESFTLNDEGNYGRPVMKKFYAPSLKNMRKRSILFRKRYRILLLCPEKPPLRWQKGLRKF